VPPTIMLRRKETQIASLDDRPSNHPQICAPSFSSKAQPKARKWKLIQGILRRRQRTLGHPGNASLAPKYIISSPRIEEQKQYMQDYALVDKFIGIWPLKHELIKWIQQWWKPKGHYDLQLGTKGFFTIILHNLEDRNRIFDRGPYFFNSTGLFFPSGWRSSALKQRILRMH
jgi:hypothetical protein